MPRMPAGKAFGTVILDRAFDLVVLVGLLVVGIAAVASSGWLVELAAAGVVVARSVSWASCSSRGTYIDRRERDRRERGLLRRLVRDTVERLAEPLGRRHLLVWLALSLGAWGTWALAALLVARSLGVELSLTEALFVTAVLNLGSAVPSSPGYVGTYEWLGVASLGLLGVEHEPALAFTILLHAAWYVPTTLVRGGRARLARCATAPAAGRRWRRGRSRGAGALGRCVAGWLVAAWQMTPRLHARPAALRTSSSSSRSGVGLALWRRWLPRARSRCSRRDRGRASRSSSWRRDFMARPYLRVLDAHPEAEADARRTSRRSRRASGASSLPPRRAGSSAMRRCAHARRLPAPAEMSLFPGLRDRLARARSASLGSVFPGTAANRSRRRHWSIVRPPLARRAGRRRSRAAT